MNHMMGRPMLIMAPKFHHITPIRRNIHTKKEHNNTLNCSTRKTLAKQAHTVNYTRHANSMVPMLMEVELVFE